MWVSRMRPRFRKELTQALDIVIVPATIAVDTTEKSVDSFTALRQDRRGSDLVNGNKQQ